jgi:hypothetical protein
MDLQKAIEIVNSFNRPNGRPLVKAVSCSVCGRHHARMVTDASFAQLHGKRIVCPRAECQREARRQRQSGDRRDDQ